VRFNSTTGSASSSNATGYTLVNQPTVRETSTPSNNSSRPWPSTSTNTRPAPVHPHNTRPNAASSTSSTRARNTDAAPRNNPSTAGEGTSTVTVRGGAAVAVRPPGAGRSVSRGTSGSAPAATAVQWSSSVSKPPAAVNSTNRRAHSANAVLPAPRSTGSPATALR